MMRLRRLFNVYSLRITRYSQTETMELAVELPDSLIAFGDSNEVFTEMVESCGSALICASSRVLSVSLTARIAVKLLMFRQSRLLCARRSIRMHNLQGTSHFSGSSGALGPGGISVKRQSLINVRSFGPPCT